MKFKSKFLLLVVALVLIVALVACNDNKQPDETKGDVTTTVAGEAVQTTTEPAVTTTEAPVVTTTKAPATTTKAPATTTKAPVTTTKTPITTTKAPATTTKAPATTTKTPVTTRAPYVTGKLIFENLVVATTAPVTTTAAPVTTTVAPATTTVAPVTTTVAPATTTVAPVTTTVAPVTTTVAPATTTVAPVTTTVAPVTTTVAPVTTTAAPVTTTAASVKYTVNYTVNENPESKTVNEGESFTLITPALDMSSLRKGKYNKFLGYFAGDVQVTDADGKKLDSYILTGDITVTAKMEEVDYSALYVQDDLMYHVSFLHAKGGEVLENYGAASSGKSAYSAYELYEADEAFYMASWKATEDVLDKGGAYYAGAPTLKDGFLLLGRNHEDGKFVSTPLRFSFSIGKTPAYYNSDYSVQVVSAACTNDDKNRPHNFFLGDFRVGFSYGIGGVESIQVRRKGISSNTLKETSFGVFFQTADENSRSLNKQTVFKTTDAVTYTFAMDKDMADTDKTYIYKDADFGGTNTAFDGTSIDYAGRCTLQAYFGNIDMGGVKAHSTLGKNYYINNSLFTIAEGNPAQLLDGVKFYALRYYNAILEPDDIEQNNFADIAYAYLLDISEFNKASEVAKKDVYKSFASITVNKITAEDAQLILDLILADYSAN